MKKNKDNRKQKKIKGNKWTMDDTELSLLSLPATIWYILFCYLPMFGIIIAFKNYKITAGKGFIYNLLNSGWAGSKNFKFLFKSGDFLILLRNTIGYNVVFIILGLAIPITLAIMMSLIYSKRKSKVYQTMMFFPHFMSWVVISYFVYAFLSTDKGLLNTLLGKQIQWYTQSQYWPFILVFMQLWKTVGYNMVVYLASITGIDGTFYEAAVIDGATKWQQARFITLPSIKPIAIMMFILNIGKVFYSDFGLFWQTTRMIPGSLFNVASTIDTYVYTALQGTAPIGMSSAVSFFQSVACCITILLANWIVSKIDNESAII